jgi:hypothetical protein
LKAVGRPWVGLGVMDADPLRYPRSQEASRSSIRSDIPSIGESAATRAAFRSASVPRLPTKGATGEVAGQVELSIIALTSTQSMSATDFTSPASRCRSLACHGTVASTNLVCGKADDRRKMVHGQDTVPFFPERRETAISYFGEQVLTPPFRVIQLTATKRRLVWKRAI